MFFNVKKSSIFNFLLEINSEKLLKKIYDNDNDVSVIVFAFN